MSRVVAVGGGTGMPVLLASLLGIADSVDAIVTVADDGGSSGRLRDELDSFPPGDSRNCLVAMSDDSILTQLFQYRFSRGEGLKSHALGNLIIAALVEITGDFTSALAAAGDIVGAKGRVMPPSLEPLTLYADVDPWSSLAQKEPTVRVTGQCNVANRLRPLRSIGIEPRDARACPEAVAAIEAADVIILGPGSLYTSIMANLLVKGIRDAIRETSARSIFLCNITVQPGETDGYSADDHLRAIQRFSGVEPDLWITSNTGITIGRRSSDGARGPDPVAAGAGKIGEGESSAEHIISDLTDEGRLARHDPAKLARLWQEIL